MMGLLKTDTPEQRAFRDFVRQVAEDVRRNFPEWKLSLETAERLKRGRSASKQR